MKPADDASPSFEASASANAHLHVGGEMLSRDLFQKPFPRFYCFTWESKRGLDEDTPQVFGHRPPGVAPLAGPKELQRCGSRT